MMGRKDFSPRLFHSLSLGQLVPADHLLRRLEKLLDLSFVRKLCAGYYSHTGQPSVDPVVIFKMMLLGYLYGITSERRLAEECSLHLAFRWYLGYDLDEPTPDHSVLSKARARFGREVFEAFFERVLKLCIEAELVGGNRLYADSTLVDANASTSSIVPREQVFDVSQTPSQHLDHWDSENAKTGTDQQEPVESRTEDADKRRKRGRKPKPGRAPRNLRKASRTDPEASIVSRPGRRTSLAYKQHFTVDSRRRVITAVTVTPGAEEDSRQVQELLDRQPIVPREFCADSHYGVANVYAELKARGIRSAIPRRSPHTRRPKPGKIPISAFQYVAEEDVYLCPEGKKLKRHYYEKRWNRYHYRALRSDCKDCPLRSACTAEGSLRTILRSPHQDAIDEAMAYLNSPSGQQTFAKRGVTAEWILAEGKNFHGLRRARCRGLGKLRIQVLLIASVQNLKRLMAALGASTHPATILGTLLQLVSSRKDTSWHVLRMQVSDKSWVAAPV
jgi:transposase